MADNNALTVSPAATELSKQYDTFTPEQVQLIHKTLMPPGAGYDQMALFLHQCARTGLDPLAKQIYALNVGGKLSVQVGIDGFRSIAERTGEMDGRDGPYWCGPDGQWSDVWLDGNPPAAARVTIYRKGQTHGYTATALWSEYGKHTGVWKTMPALMLAKCAEALALRQAFPADLSGLYTPDEMAQADTEKTKARMTEMGLKAAPPKKPKAPPAVGADGEFIPPEDTKKTATGQAKAKLPCHHCKESIAGNTDIAYGKWDSGDWYIAHWKCHSDAVEPKFQGDPVVDAEYDEVEVEAKKAVRKAVKGKPAEKLVDSLVGPEADEKPEPEVEVDEDALDAEVPN
jgi:phage recombination protein Bet